MRPLPRTDPSPAVAWFRLMIRHGEKADEQLHALCDHVCNQWKEDGIAARDVAVFSRPTERGGYDVRFTAPLHGLMRRAAPYHYIEECDQPRGWDRWTLRAGKEDWPERLGIRTAE